MELKDYLRIVKRRWWLVGLCCITVLLMHVSYIKTRPQFYSAQAKIIVKEVSPYYYIGVSTQPNIFEILGYTTMLGLIKSEPVMIRVVSKLYPEGKVYTYNEKNEKILNYGFLSQQIPKIRGLVKVNKEDESEFVTLYAKDQNDAFIVKTLNTLAKEYKAYIAEESSTRILNSLKQLSKRKKELTLLIYTKQKKLQEQTAISSGGSFFGSSTKLLSSLEKDMSELKSNLRDIEIQIQYIEDDLANGSAIALSNIEKSPELKSMLEEQQGLKRQLSLALSKYTDKHSEVKRLKKAIEEIEKNIVSEQKKEQDSVVVDEIMKKEKELLGLKYQKKRIEEQLNAKQEEIVQILEKVRKPKNNNEKDVNSKEQQDEEMLASMEDDPQFLSFFVDNLINEYRLITERMSVLEENKNWGKDIVKINALARKAYPIPKSGTDSWPFAVIIGAIAGIGIAYFLEYINTTIRTEHDVKRYLNIPLFGAIIKIKNADQKNLLNVAPNQPIYEVFNTIGTLMESYAEENEAQSFIITSARPEEGKSMISSNIAISLANGGQSVIIVDCDLRKSVLHKIFNLDRTVGVTNYILSKIEKEKGHLDVPEIKLNDIIKSTEVKGLSVIPAGPHPQNPVSLLKSDTFKNFVMELKSKADIILFDVPPVNLAVDTLVLASIVDASLLLVSAGEANKDEVTYAKRLLENARGNLIGCILNKITIESKGYYYYYYYGGYKYYRET